MKKSKTVPATNERFAVVWNWESDMKILYIENTFDEALAKFKKKLKPFLKDNEGIEGKFDMEKCNLIAYSHGQYFTLGENIGKFGYSVQKKKKK